MADKDRIVFDGVTLKERDRECLTALLDHDGNNENLRTPVDAGYVIDNTHRLNHRSSVSRARTTLEDAGLVDVFEEEHPDPLNDANLMRPTDAAIEHSEWLRWEPKRTLEERVDRLEEMVMDAASDGRMEIAPNPDEFEF